MSNADYVLDSEAQDSIVVITLFLYAGLTPIKNSAAEDPFNPIWEKKLVRSLNKPSAYTEPSCKSIGVYIVNKISGEKEQFHSD